MDTLPSSFYTSPESAAIGTGSADEMSALIARGLAGSGIDAAPGHFLHTPPQGRENGQEWLADERCQMALYAVASSYLCNDNIGHTRRYGKNVTELVHVIWVGHSAYNNPTARKDLAAAGMPPTMLAIAGCLHDIVEDTQKSIRLKGLLFDKDEFHERLCQIIPLNSPVERAFLRATVFDHLTDRDDPALSGHSRIAEQAGKHPRPPSDAGYISNLNLPDRQLTLFLTAVKSANVAIRAADKFNNLARDCMSRDAYGAARRADPSIQSMSLAAKREVGLPDEDLKITLEQAEIKIYALRRYGVRHLGFAYERMLEFLRSERIAVREHFRMVARGAFPAAGAATVPVTRSGFGHMPRAAEAPQVL
ncbi:MAG: hypothetical protein KGI37_01535 [Alphaproteobacteria bacterium]|nr:hypothetical protein [Alphaproteobacteria bacterium]